MKGSSFFQDERWQWVSLLVLCSALFFPGLGARDFWAPVEPRYAEIARVMFTKGEWIVPTVNGKLYTDKPILYFWLILVVSKLAGAVNEWTVRLPVALAGVGFVSVTYCLGRDFFSARIGLLAAAILATMVRVIWEARWAHIDILFCFFFLFSVYHAARAVLKKGHPNEILIAYVFMGLATLAKGLIGIVLPALLLIGFMVARRDWRMLAAAKLHWGIPIFLVVVVPWLYLVSSATDGKWLTEFIYVHHLRRYTAWIGHREPFYYYLTTLPVDVLPWTIFAIPALYSYRGYGYLLAEPSKLLLVVWFLVVFVFFSASDSKRDLYLLPLLPTVAIFIAHYFDDLAAGRLQGPLFRLVTLIFYSLLTVTGLILPWAAWLVRRDVFWISLPTAAVLTAAGGLAIYFVWRKQPLKLAALTALAMVLTMLSIVFWIFPYVERFKSRRFFSMEVQTIVPHDATVYVYDDEMNDFNYYMQREVIPVLRSRAAVEKLMGGGSGAYLLIKSTDLKRLGIIAPQQIRITGAIGSTLWNLVALGGSPPQR
ncbi:MAG TPA: glycosyltransferase family 39 protein [Candidatus Binatia bacterium]|nr:glycosyltransferase family 39 protein [Candidatus Binatia bacterium]